MVNKFGLRKTHAVAIARIGGIAVALGAEVLMLVWLTLVPEITGFLAGTAAIAVAGVLD